MKKYRDVKKTLVIWNKHWTFGKCWQSDNIYAVTINTSLSFLYMLAVSVVLYLIYL